MTTVLLVDGAKASRKETAAAIAALAPAADILEADSTEDAINLARAAPVDVALIDLDAPGRDGLVLASDLVAINPDTRVTFVSASSAAQDAAYRWKGIGAAFVTKPLSPEALAAVLERDD